MTLKVEIGNKAASSWTDITDKVKVYDGMRVGGNAHLGEVGTGSGLDLDDDAGTLTLPVKRIVRIRETATSPDTILVRGRIAGKGVSRGEMPVGDARAFDVELDDQNADLRGIPIRAWSRPAETDYQRVIALWKKFLKGKRRASTRLRIDYVRNANRRNLPKQTYRNTDPYGVLADIAEAAGKEFFVTVDGELFYDLPISTRYAAGLSITDDDPNMTDEFPPLYGASGDYDGSEFISGATIEYGDRKRVAGVRSSAESAHDYWRTIITEDATGQNDARRRLKALLSSQAREDATYTVDLELTADQVDMIKYGQTVSFRSAAAGVKTPVVLRVGRLMWEPTAPGHYLAHLELGFPKKLAPRIPRGGSSGGLSGSGGNNPGNPTAPQGPTVHPPAAVTRLPLDDFERTGGLAALGGLVTTANPSATSHEIAIPDGSEAPGRLLWVWLSCGYAPTMNTQMDDAMSAAGFYGVSGFVSYNGAGGQYAKVYAKMTDGNDAGSVDITLSTSVGVMAIAGVASGATAIEASEALPNLSDQADPPSLDPSWASGDDALWYTVGYIDDAISGDPSGYTNVVSGLTNGTYNVRASYKADDSATEDPSAYTGTATSGFAGGAFTIALADPSAITSALTTSSGTSHEIALPDGLQTGDGLVVFMAYTRETAETLYNEVITPDWPDSAYGQGDGGGSAGQEQIWLWKQLDGTEGFTGADDTFTIDHDIATSNLYAIAIRIPRIAMLPTEGFPWNAISSWGETPGGTPTWDTWDVTTGYSEWVTTDPCIRFVILSGTGTISDLPSGYTVLSSVDNGTLYFAVAYKDDVSTDSDTPTPDPTLGTGHHVISSFGVRTTGIGTGWGSIPFGRGIDHAGPWDGGNTWETEVVAGAADVHLDAGTGRIDATADGTHVTAILKSASPDEPSEGPWGPWTDGRPDKLYRWKVDPVGDTGDAAPNRLAIGVYDGDSRNKLYINLGDDVAWSYMDPDNQRGIALGTGDSSYSDFVAKTIASDTWYYTRLDFRADTLRAKLWAATDPEPSSWDVTLAREEETGLADVRWLRLDLYGNAGMSFYLEEIDVLVPDDALAGVAGEVYGLTQTVAVT